MNYLAVLSPLVLAADLLLLLWGEVVGNVEGLADLLWGLSLDHIGDGLAADVKESLDVKIIGGKDDLKEHLLVDLHELLIPLLDIGGLLAGVGIILGVSWWVAAVMLAPLEDLSQNGLVHLREGLIHVVYAGRFWLVATYVWNRDTSGEFTHVLKHVGDKDRARGDRGV